MCELSNGPREYGICFLRDSSETVTLSFEPPICVANKNLGALDQREVNLINLMELASDVTNKYGAGERIKIWPG